MNVLENGTRSRSRRNLHIRALSGISIRQVRHTKVASGRGWSVVFTILGTRRLTDDVLNSTFCLVEYALNSCPLTPVSVDPSDLGAITPNLFLIGNQATRTRSIVGVDEFDHRKRYARAQSYTNATWARWFMDYISALNSRSKWRR